MNTEEPKTTDRCTGRPLITTLPHGATAFVFDDESGPPPEDWLCPTCKGTSEDWARPVDDENIAVNACDPDDEGLWECGNCGNTEWVPPNA